MKLRTPEVFWLLKNGILKSYPSLESDINCDIAVTAHFNQNYLTNRFSRFVIII
jgi:hypothetical protein